MHGGTKHKIGTMVTKQWRRKTLSEHVSKLICRGNMLNKQVTFDNMFSNKVIINLKMLHPGMKHWIGSERNSRDIITMN
jgi:hypothetical protein